MTELNSTAQIQEALRRINAGEADVAVIEIYDPTTDSFKLVSKKRHIKELERRLVGLQTCDKCGTKLV